MEIKMKKTLAFIFTFTLGIFNLAGKFEDDDVDLVPHPPIQVIQALTSQLTMELDEFKFDQGDIAKVNALIAQGASLYAPGIGGDYKLGPLYSAARHLNHNDFLSVIEHATNYAQQPNLHAIEKVLENLNMLARNQVFFQRVQPNSTYLQVFLPAPMDLEE